MVQILLAEQCFDGTQIHRNLAVTCDGGRIVSVENATKIKNPDCVQKFTGLLAPGLIDVQVNGGGGVLFNNTPTVSTLKQMGAAHARFGTTGFVPTLITDRLEVMQRAADAVSVALRSKVPGVLGIHFEGPHLNTAKKGTHEARLIRSLTNAELMLYARKDLGTKVITLAPETVSPQAIQQLVSLGVKVCLGHSNANGATVSAAIAAGATGFTHLYNTMSPLQSREPGMVGMALISDSAWCGLIADGHHVNSEVMELAIRAKPQGKLMLVTDAMALVGSEDTQFPLFERTVSLHGDRLTSSTGELAGSQLNMMAAVHNIHQWCGLEIIEALRMGGLYPAQFLGSSGGRIVAGAPADFILLNNALQLKKTWIAGQEIFSR
ncbi:MAG: N-acetylglucosamine-6-phosphate deacetylase [Gammaproteobacteria bacterium]|nr:N-acetylglucosamine-6-phosphate deacetylase [Gammaproteobacteria bacterium]